MRLWQMAALILGPAALLFTAQPARAQVWIGGGPVVVGPAWGAPAWGAPAYVVGPAWGRPVYPVARARYVRPRRFYRRGSYRTGWYGGAWGPSGVWVAGRRW